MRYITTITLLFLLISCENIRFENKNLYGSWADEKTNSTIKIVFRNDNSFTLTNISHDVISEYSGVFFINHNPNRNTYTLTLVPNVLQDSIFIKCTNYDIINFSDTMFVVKEPTRRVKTTVGIVKDEYYWSFKKIK